eukprot:g23682.t1
MIVRTNSMLGVDNEVMYTYRTTLNILSGHSPSPPRTDDDKTVLSGWTVEVFVSTLHSLYPQLKWGLVYQLLDLPEMQVPNRKGLRLLMDIWTHVNGPTPCPFPLAHFLRPWKHKASQLSVLRELLRVPQSILNITAVSTHTQAVLPDLQLDHFKNKAKDVSSEVYLQRTFQAWFCVDVIECLLGLGETDLYPQVRELMDPALANCPEMLLCGLVQAHPGQSLGLDKHEETECEYPLARCAVRDQLLAKLLPTYLGCDETTGQVHKNARPVCQRLWELNPKVVIDWLVKLYQQDRDMLPRVLDVAQELEALTVVLDSGPFHYTLDLATLAAKRGYLDLEKWLQLGIFGHGSPFVEACLSYLRAHAKSSTVLPTRGEGGAARTAQWNVFYLEDAALFFKALLGAKKKKKGALSAKNAKAVDQQYQECSDANPRLEAIVDDVEEDATSFFHHIYTREISVPEAVTMLHNFKNSEVKREQDVYACMLHNLFDEYRFYHQYPEQQLEITAMLLGQCIQHKLLSNSTLPIALRYVLDSLRQDPSCNMHRFALWALAQFQSKLHLWPQFCQLLLQIPHLSVSNAKLVSFLQDLLDTRNKNLTAKQKLESSPSPQPQQPPPQQPQAALGSGGESDSGSNSSNNTDNNSVSPAAAVLATGPAAAPAVVAPAASLLPPIATSSDDSSLLDHNSSTERDTAGPAPPGLLPLPIKPPEPGLASSGPSDLIGFGGSDTDLARGAPAGGSGRPADALEGDIGDGGGVEGVPGDSGAGGEAGASGGGGAGGGGAGNPGGGGGGAGGSGGDDPGRNNGPGKDGHGGADKPAKSKEDKKEGESNEAKRRRRERGAQHQRAAFGSAININTLLDAGRDDSLVPPTAVADKIHFIVNNVTKETLHEKANELKKILKAEYFPYFCRYVVVKRASVEPNNHELYGNLIDIMNQTKLKHQLKETTYYYIKILLKSATDDGSRSEKDDRRLLRNLGSWLGCITLAKNKPLRANMLDLSQLIIDAYDEGRLIVVIPFVANVMKACKDSRVFKPPNPWLMSMVGLLREVLDIPQLKLTLKFSIEVLFNDLGIVMKETTPSSLLKDVNRKREVERITTVPEGKLPESAIVSPGGDRPVEEFPAEGGRKYSNSSENLAAPPAATAGSSTDAAQSPSLTSVSPAPNPPGGGLPPSLAPSAAGPAGAAAAAVAAAAAAAAAGRDGASMVPPLDRYINYHPGITLFNMYPRLKQFVATAIDRAIREIITPVVERSVTIACVTTRELILKDFCMEPDENKM